MNWLFKVAIFTAPVFVVSLVVYFAQHKNFERDFQTENVRFERQFQKEWGNWGNDTTDNFLEKQQKLAEKYWQERPSEEMAKLEKGLRSAIQEAKNSTNGTIAIEELRQHTPGGKKWEIKKK